MLKAIFNGICFAILVHPLVSFASLGNLAISSLVSPKSKVDINLVSSSKYPLIVNTSLATKYGFSLDQFTKMRAEAFCRGQKRVLVNFKTKPFVQGSAPLVILQDNLEPVQAPGLYNKDVANREFTELNCLDLGA